MKILVFIGEVDGLIPQDLHRLLRLLPHLLGILQLALQQLLQLLVLLLHLLVPDGLLHQRVDAAGLDRGLLRVPVIVTKRVLQYGYLLDHLVVGCYDLLDVGIAEFLVMAGLRLSRSSTAYLSSDTWWI